MNGDKFGEALAAVGLLIAIAGVVVMVMHGC